MINKYYKKGFTLIELLLVISIISLLSTIVLGSIRQSRIRARDSKTMSELKQLQIALELFRSENGRYPSTVGCAGPSTPCSNAGDFSGKQSHWGVVGVDSLVELLASKNNISKDVLKDFQKTLVINDTYFGNGYHSAPDPIYACTHKTYGTNNITTDMINRLKNSGYFISVNLSNEHTFDVLKTTVNEWSPGTLVTSAAYKNAFAGTIRLAYHRTYLANTLCVSDTYFKE